MSNIKNIVFDLGNVLLDIDLAKTDAAFEALGVPDFRSKYSLTKADKLFDNLETGHATDADFYDGMRRICNLPLTNQHICNAWNALLLNFRTESLQWMETNNHRFKYYLLSNTNAIHATAFHESFTKQTGLQNFNNYFTKPYYSYLVGMRKPEKEIFEFALTDAGIKADETLFIDDLQKNIDAAAMLGIHTHCLLAHERVENLGL
jgi:glucose-1-phosphatase